MLSDLPTVQETAKVQFLGTENRCLMLGYPKKRQIALIGMQLKILLPRCCKKPADEERPPVFYKR